MGGSGIPRINTRLLVIAVAIATLLIAAHSVISQLSGPEVYDADDTEISVEAGDRFTVQVAGDSADGYRWIIAAPRPDPAVLKAAGQRADPDEPPPSGSGGSRYLDFRAVHAGRTDLRLVRCRRCAAGAAEEAGAQSLNFRVTVR
ncbi:protease inhibitor I42 family protein [Streptomyces halobius]|uniref:Protease inhibitor I42 family protein n=1 Tax=Streptomyces halobius TaxID=2879846 RepID=A0ABY4MCM2_9ACTN|nr:protease inhibitor I42 family protein [Streptomyces halobius]UQA95072.1 protease inhibitor I42 family protein [Streptomyces halobius]